MTFTLNTTSLRTLQSMETQAQAGQIGFWEIYDWLADTLESNGVASSDQTVLWLRGATEANAGRGAMAGLIREYTQTQYELRYGTRLTGEQMQTASDAVAQNLLDDLLGRNPPWPAGQVPDITRIAKADATAVGETLFNAAGDTSAPPTNAAWSGTLLFSLLGSDQTSRLISTNASGKLDTLNDLRDVLYAFVAYAEGFKAARAEFLLETPQQKAIDTVILGHTIASYIEGPGTPESLLRAMLDGTDNPVLHDAFNRIGEVGANRFLDMLKGAMQGVAVIGATTEDNFVRNAYAYFGEFSAEQLQSLKAELLPADAAALVLRATDDVNVRAALAGLSIVSVQVSEEVAARLSLYDPVSGQGELSKQWLIDRAEMLVWRGIFDKQGVPYDDRLNSLGGLLPMPVQGDHVYQDVASGLTLDIDGVNPTDLSTRYVRFGGDSADTLAGAELDDHLYGGAGDDTINGLGGADYLEGNTGADKLDGGEGNDTLLGGQGTDTYSFSGAFGSDVIEDADHSGSISVEGLGTLSGADAKKTSAEGSTWVSEDGRQSYSVVQMGDRQDLNRLQPINETWRRAA